MTPQELKNSILQLAIQGKLVEQRPEEGTAEELYQQIQNEKQKLVKAGTIKKEKRLPEITEDEIPFDIPESWKWVRLGDCSSYSQKKEKVNASNITADMWSLDLEDIEKETGRIIIYRCASERKIAGDKVKFYKGQILYSRLRPYLKKILVAPNNGICTPEMVPFVAYGSIDAQFFVYVLKSPYVDFTVNSVTYGVKMPRVGTDTMDNLLIPLPPLAEQKRIVAKIEELLPYIDRYEEAWSKLEELNKRFSTDMQKSILQMAIQGKLVEQRPEEGSAEELCQQIQAEKQRLIKEGKIKKEKPLPEITEDEIPFDIPKSWKWVRLGETVKISTGKKDANHGSENGKYVFFTCARDSIRANTYSYNGECIILPGNGANVGLSIYFNGKFEAYQRTYVLEKYLAKFNMKYLQTALLWNWQRYNSNRLFGSAIPYIKLGNLQEFYFPLPPLAEQKRIVAKLEEILPLCEKLN